MPFLAMSGGFCTRPMLIEALDSKLRRAVRARGFSPVTTPRLKLNSSLLVLRDAVDYATARMVHGQVAVRRPVLWGCLDNLRGQTPNLPLQQHAQLRRADYHHSARSRQVRAITLPPSRRLASSSYLV